MIVRLPIDLMSLPPFRHVEATLGPVRSVWAWWLAWRELAYLAQEGLAPGRVRVEDLPSFIAMLAVPDMANGSMANGLAIPNGQGVSGAEIWALLTASRLFKADGPDWVCPRFALLHTGASASRSAAQRGGDQKAYNQRQKKTEGLAFQQGLMLDASKLQDEHGEPLAPEQRQRVTRLIVSCDNALFKDPLPLHGYTEGLVQDALRVLAQFSDEEIDRVCHFVSAHRNHPMLTTTEKLLPQFGEIVRILEGLQ